MNPNQVPQIYPAPRGVRYIGCQIFISGYAIMRINGDAASVLDITDDDRIAIGKVGEDLYVAKAFPEMRGHNLTKSYKATARTRTLMSYSATYSRFAGGYNLTNTVIRQRLNDQTIRWFKLVKVITPY